MVGSSPQIARASAFTVAEIPSIREELLDRSGLVNIKLSLFSLAVTQLAFQRSTGWPPWWSLPDVTNSRSFFDGSDIGTPSTTFTRELKWASQLRFRRRQLRPGWAPCVFKPVPLADPTGNLPKPPILYAIGASLPPYRGDDAAMLRAWPRPFFGLLADFSWLSLQVE